jgi:mono/diheme cytochrome c family protein
MKKMLCGGAVTIAALLVVFLAIVRLGLISVGADSRPPRLETYMMPKALHYAIARHALEQKNPLAANEENLLAAGEIYKGMCARCHSVPGGEPSVFGASFYPPAPQLSGGMSNYTDAQLFWIIKHGIRNTGMPAWGAMLSDEAIWQLVALLKNGQDLPPSVEREWVGGH